MPELPEVETVCRALQASVAGAVIGRVELRRANLRIPFPRHFAKNLTCRRITQVTRRAKYLLFHLDDGQILLSHLGMSGCFKVEDSKTYQPITHDHVLYYLSDGRVLAYHDPRRFGLMTLLSAAEISTHNLLAHLGVEPLSSNFTPRYLREKLAARSGAIKPALMDQTLVVGVGNIYASEALFLAGVRPQTPARNALKAAPALVRAIRTTLTSAIESGGSSLRDFVHVSGETGYFQHHFNVYGRAEKPCLTCGETILSLVQSGRSGFYCPTCQG